MNLPKELISEFVRATDDSKTNYKKETTLYGTAVIKGNQSYVRLDGSSIDTPVTSTVGMTDGERVTVMIKDHMAVVTGNVSTPAATEAQVEKKIKDVNFDLSDIREELKILTDEEVDAICS